MLTLVIKFLLIQGFIVSIEQMPEYIDNPMISECYALQIEQTENYILACTGNNTGKAIVYIDVKGL